MEIFDRKPLEASESWYHRSMEESQSAGRRSSVSFWVFIVGLIGLGVYAMISLNQTAAIYDGALTQQSQENDGSVGKISFPGVNRAVNIPNWTLLKPGNIWSLVSRDHPLPNDFKVPNIVNTEVAHGDSDQPMQVQATIEQPLKRIFAAAEDDGIELMLSSAYRSVSDQQALYDNFVAKQGQAMADLYVAKPGTSEHHTGLAVDFASASAACESDSDKCSLSQAAANWLLENGPKYGFVQRYPEGKQPITGVAFEPWHYRYLGIPLAQAVAASDLTYDEAIKQFAPGYAK